MNPNRIKNNDIFDGENTKDDLFNNNFEKNKAKTANEKSTNLSENDDGNNYDKSNQGNNRILLFYL